MKNLEIPPFVGMTSTNGQIELNSTSYQISSKFSILKSMIFTRTDENKIYKNDRFEYVFLTEKCAL